ncbi:hypothetical protein [Legionella fallonii]|uniref:Uncharacterized protein n=1 Tax=Legionella fallonii LLAP-10 TaxID=1212491 RepID=A0A098G6C7_9GAMM|nr:hypothetical protein [Legionella fallonii]CEG58048.1 protein of unknown function [Legionella fallonii LLAP-10]
MSGPSEESVGNNRYSTFQAQVKHTSLQPGVSSEFAHNTLLRLIKLLQKLEPTVNGPSVNLGTKEFNNKGLSALQECISSVDKQIQEKSESFSPRI